MPPPTPDSRPLSPAGEARLLETAALVASLLVCLLGQMGRELWAPDEMREAGISRAMARTGDYLTPRLNRTPFLEKPPLFHALAAAVFTITGSSSRLAARLPAILCGLASLGATYLLARRLGGRRLGAMAAAVLATTAEFFSACHNAVTDGAVLPLVTIAFLLFLRLLSPRATWKPWLGVGLALGFAFLAKGAPGPVVFFAGGLAYLAWDGRLEVLKDRRLALGAAGFLVPVLAWIGALYLREGEWAVEEVLRQNLFRATSASADHGKPIWFYLREAPLFFLPWTPFLLGGAVAALRHRTRGQTGRWAACRLPAAWLLSGLIVFSIASAKRRVYLLPLAPAGAILAATAVEWLFFAPKPALPASLAGLRRLAGRRAGWLVATAFILIALGFTLGYRTTWREKDAARGFETFARETAATFREFPAVLYRPTKDESATEGLRGALTYYFDRDFPEVIGAEGLSALRARPPGPEFAVIASGHHGEIEVILGPGRIIEHREFIRGDAVVAVYRGDRR